MLPYLKSWLLCAFDTTLLFFDSFLVMTEHLTFFVFFSVLLRNPGLILCVPFQLLTLICNTFKKCWFLSVGNSFQRPQSGTSLVVQWLRIHLIMQGTRVWSLVPEDSTATEQLSLGTTLLSPCALEPTHHDWRKPAHSSKDPGQPQINKSIFFTKDHSLDANYYIASRPFQCRDEKKYSF